MISPHLRLAIVGALLCIPTLVLLIIYGRQTHSCAMYIGKQSTTCPAEINNALSYIESLETDNSTSSSCRALHFSITVPVNNISRVEMKVTCPWKHATSITGYVGIAFSLIFLIVFTLMDIKPEIFETTGRFWWIGGALASLTLSASYILMILDIAKGQGYREDYFVPLQEQTIPNPAQIDTDCVGFILNFIVTIAVIVVIGTASCWSFRSFRRVMIQSEISEVLHAKR